MCKAAERELDIDPSSVCREIGHTGLIWLARQAVNPQFINYNAILIDKVEIMHSDCENFTSLLPLFIIVKEF